MAQDIDPVSVSVERFAFLANNQGGTAGTLLVLEWMIRVFLILGEIRHAPIEERSAH